MSAAMTPAEVVAEKVREFFGTVAPRSTENCISAIEREFLRAGVRLVTEENPS